MANWTVRPINTGFIPTYPKQYHYHHSVHPYIKNISDEKEPLPDFFFLLEGNGKKILVDTGMAWTERANKFHHPGSWQDPGQASFEQLESLDIDCKDIDYVLFTHMHWDHVFYLDKFTNATFIAHERELAFALDPIPVYYKSYEHPFLGIERPFEGIKIDTCSGEEEIVPGVRAFETFGHSPGHMSIEVDTLDGRFIMGGDSAFRIGNFDAIPEIGYTVTPPSRFADIVECWKSLEIQKERAESIDKILLSHETALLDRCKETPVFGLGK